MAKQELASIVCHQLGFSSGRYVDDVPSDVRSSVEDGAGSTPVVLAISPPAQECGRMAAAGGNVTGGPEALPAQCVNGSGNASTSTVGNAYDSDADTDSLEDGNDDAITSSSSNSSPGGPAFMLVQGAGPLASAAAKGGERSSNEIVAQQCAGHMLDAREWSVMLVQLGVRCNVESCCLPCGW